jgi:4-amino-4-deoxy-L-arabinose transferase-like glycosyltransferase
MNLSAPRRPFVRADERRLTRRARQHSLLWSAIPLALATAAIGLFRIGHQALSSAESISIAVAQLPLAGMLRTFADSGVSPHAFYELLLHIWQFGGTSETFLRSMSVCLGAGTVLTLFALNVHLFDRRTAVASCTLLIVNISFVRYMQEIGPYALALCLVVVASWCFTAALTRPSTGRWLTYGVAGAAAMWAHGFAGFVVLGHAISLTVRWPRPPFRRVSAGYAMAAALMLPLVLFMRPVESMESSVVPPPLPGASFEQAFLYLAGGALVPSGGTYLLPLMLFALCCAGLIVVARAENRHRHSAGQWANAFVVLWLAVPVAATFCISLARPTVDPRPLLLVLPALATIAGIGVSSLPHRTLRGLALAVVVALYTVALLSYYRVSISVNGDWPAATSHAP